MRRAIDERNLLAALRLRDALASGAAPPAEDTLLPGGSIAPARFEAAVRAPVPASVAGTLGRIDGETWRPPLARWAATGDLSALERELERRRIADTTMLFTRGDPLTIRLRADWPGRGVREPPRGARLPPARPADPAAGAGARPPGRGPGRERRVHFAPSGFVATPVYARARLALGAGLPGPAIVEQADTTTVVPPGWAVLVEESGNLRIRRNGRAES